MEAAFDRPFAVGIVAKLAAALEAAFGAIVEGMEAVEALGQPAIVGEEDSKGLVELKFN